LSQIVASSLSGSVTAKASLQHIPDVRPSPTALT